ncbi:hypothetical protein AAHA92_12262 [Salvia divinorum]|uniref:Uncharacterized protein n=1 Tax=Salvia divinorum TaxID=28513 RepID=A0ABD1HJP5_SALDI
MDFPAGMGDPYYYEESQEGCYEEYPDYNHEQQFYQDTYSDFSYSAQEYYSDENMELCAGLEEEPPALWEILLYKCITELEENRKTTNLRLNNLEKNTTILEQTLSNLVVQVGDLEYNMGVMTTAIGSKHTPGQFPSLPEINPKENCHAIQLRSGTTYTPPNTSDLGQARKEKGSSSSASPAVQSHRSAGEHASDPLSRPPLVPAASTPAAAKPKDSGPLEEDQMSDTSQRPAEKQSNGPPLSPGSVVVPFPHRLTSKKLDAQFAKFLEVMSKVHINVPLVEALQQMPNYAKFLKDVVAKKRKWGKYETVGLTENCSAIIQNGVPTKHKDPGSFTLSCTLGNNVKGKALCDLGASINLMLLSFYRKLNIDSIRPTSITLQMADRRRQERPVDTWKAIPSHGGAMIDVQKGELTLWLNKESITFNIYDALKFHGKEGAEGYEECSVIQVVTDYVGEVEVTYHRAQEALEACLVNSFTPTNDLIDYGADVCAMVRELDMMPEKIHQRGNNFLPLRTPEEEEHRNKEAKTPKGPPKVELKSLPAHLRYAFFRENSTYPVVVSAALSEKECDKLVCVLNKYRSAIGWSISDLKGISPTMCMHRILLEDGHKPRVQNQRRLNPIMQDVVRNEVVAKKGGMTIVPG